MIALVLIADQALKIWIKTNFMIGEEIRMIGDWAILHFVENNGMAFGMELGGEFGKLALSVFRIIAVSLIGWFLFKQAKQTTFPKGLIVCIALIFAGAIGNIIDSMFYGLIFTDSWGRVAEMFPEGGGYATFLHGKVVDMFYFPMINSTWPDWVPYKGGHELIFFRPVFNIADAAISVGMCIALIFYRKHLSEAPEVKNK